MADETTTPALANSAEARTPDGTLKDQTPSTTTETKPADTSTTTEAEGGTTLLTEGEKKPEGEVKPEDKKEPVKGAPEKYEAFKAPEGYTYDEKGLAEASAVFKDLGLSQDQAQKLMDVYASKSLEAAKEATDRGQKAVDEMRKSWRDSVAADPEIGKKLSEVKVTIGRALDSLGDQKLTSDFKAAMDLTGVGDHPAFVKAFYKLAQAVVEGSHVSGGGPSPHGQAPNGKLAKPTPAQAMYPNLPTQS